MTCTYTPFQKHLLFYSAPNTSPPKVTIGSALRASLRLGLNFPLSLAVAVALRLLYSPFPCYWRAVDIAQIPAAKMRTQLEAAPTARTDGGYSRIHLLQMAQKSDGRGRKGLTARLIDQGHVLAFWSISADTRTGLVAASQLQRFQQGPWQDAIVARRRFRDAGKFDKSGVPGVSGKPAGDVLPFWRGGPLSVAGHSWAVRRAFGVHVYE